MKRQIEHIDCSLSRLREFHGAGVRRLYVMVTRASFSGLTRWVRVFLVENGDIVDVTFYAAHVTGWRLADKSGRWEMAVRGCGFSAEEHTVETINHRLGLPDGFAGGFKAARL